jgi:hypothetical protein
MPPNSPKHWRKMNYCANCGMSLDVCNQSQPVCPYCGEDDSNNDSCHHAEDLLSEPMIRLAPEDEIPAIPENLDATWTRYTGDSRGVRLRHELRGVCIQCGSKSNGSSFFVCTNSQCGETWRVNHCGLCKEIVDSRDPDTPRCLKCGWLICAACHACNCAA